MNGILVVDKPPAKTSHDIVDFVRKATGLRKVGHTGTLDPMATGVLVLLLGQATRVAQFLELEPKEYIAEAVFGIRTDTQDITGRVIQDIEGRTNPEAIRAIIPEFSGEISQVPPMVSAVKIGGKPLYKLARQGKEIERPQRKVFIYRLEMVDFFEKDNRDHAVFHVICSGGTYIRTLVNDIGERLGLGATLAALRRTRVGSFDLSEALSFDGEVSKDRLARHLISLDDALRHLPEVIAREDAKGIILNGGIISGQQIKKHPNAAAYNEFVRIKSMDSSLLAIGKIAKTNGIAIKPKVVFKLKEIN
ncbi:MAG: tRNA pseudouridine(55) synthase TruB [Firmicutes bacterium]|nr:tRNA pseudouridine(55) synthase TruB [Bacillota bacterium]